MSKIKVAGAAEYIETVYGTEHFVRLLNMHDVLSIMDLMGEYSLACQEQLRRDCAKRALPEWVDGKIVAVDKQSILETPLIK